MVISLYGYAKMQTIALISEKGGAGKSTIAVHLAVSAARRGGTVAIFDLDPQASASQWAERRGKDADAEPVTVVQPTIQELPRLIQSARSQGANLVILDTAGRSDVTTHHALAAADFALTPCRPSLYDLEATRRTAEIVKGAGRKGYVILNACPPRGSRAQEARDALERVTTVAPVELHQLVAYSDALNDGRSVEELEPAGKAAQEIGALYQWISAI